MGRLAPLHDPTPSSPRPESHTVERPVAKWDIFHDVYAVLHHPAYRSRFAEVLKKELPRVPLLAEFGRYVAAGRALAALHVHYEHVPTHPGLIYRWAEGRPASYRVVKMKLSKGKDELVVNEALTIAGIPPEVADYRLGNRSALEWVVDQYQVDGKTGEDPNRPEDERYVVELVGRVAALSARTSAIVAGLPAWPSGDGAAGDDPPVAGRGGGR